MRLFLIFVMYASWLVVYCFGIALLICMLASGIFSVGIASSLADPPSTVLIMNVHYCFLVASIPIGLLYWIVEVVKIDAKSFIVESTEAAGESSLTSPSAPSPIPPGTDQGISGSDYCK